MSNPLRWGILATGAIARTFAQALRNSETGRLVAVGSRSLESARRFGAGFDLPAARCHSSYEALLADPEVDAVYISNPHPGHAEWAVKCAEAGKHILCEKPLAMNAREAGAVIQAARRAGVFLMEAFMYRCHPQTARLVDLVRSGAIGRVRLIQATFSVSREADGRSRLFDPALGGGSVLDLGCYAASMSRLVAGAAIGQPFAEPLDFSAASVTGQTGVDLYTTAIARFPQEILAQLSCGLGVTQDNSVRVYGETGWIHVPTPWQPGADGGGSRLLLHRPGTAQPEEIAIAVPGAADYVYTLEANEVAARLADRESPAMSWADTLGNMQTLDRWRAAIGLTYPGEDGVGADPG